MFLTSTDFQLGSYLKNLPNVYRIVENNENDVAYDDKRADFKTKHWNLVVEQTFNWNILNLEPYNHPNTCA